MPKSFFYQNSSDTISSICGKIRGFILFSKVNVGTRLEIELTSYLSADQHFNKYGDSPIISNTVSRAHVCVCVWYFEIETCGFRSQLQATYESRHTEELWYYEIVCEWQYIRSPMGIEHSGEGINGYHSHNAKLFEWIGHSSIR